MTGNIDWFISLVPHATDTNTPAKEYTLYQLLADRKSFSEGPLIQGDRLFDGGIALGRKSGVTKEDRCSRGFSSPVVSRSHAQLSVTRSGHVYITDLSSLHGTHLEALGEGSFRLIPWTPTQLLDGDTLILGKNVHSERADHESLKLSVHFRFPHLGRGSSYHGKRSFIHRLSSPEQAYRKFAAISDKRFVELAIKSTSRDRPLKDESPEVQVVEVRSPTTSEQEGHNSESENESTGGFPDQLNEDAKYNAAERTGTYGVPLSLLYESENEEDLPRGSNHNSHQGSQHGDESSPIQSRLNSPNTLPRELLDNNISHIKALTTPKDSQDRSETAVEGVIPQPQVSTPHEQGMTPRGHVSSKIYGWSPEDLNFIKAGHLSASQAEVQLLDLSSHGYQVEPDPQAAPQFSGEAARNQAEAHILRTQSIPSVPINSIINTAPSGSEERLSISQWAARGERYFLEDKRHMSEPLGAVRESGELLETRNIPAEHASQDEITGVSFVYESDGYEEDPACDDEEDDDAEFDGEEFEEEDYDEEEENAWSDDEAGDSLEGVISDPTQRPSPLPVDQVGRDPDYGRWYSYSSDQEEQRAPRHRRNVRTDNGLPSPDGHNDHYQDESMDDHVDSDSDGNLDEEMKSDADEGDVPEVLPTRSDRKPSYLELFPSSQIEIKQEVVKEPAEHKNSVEPDPLVSASIKSIVKTEGRLKVNHLSQLLADDSLASASESSAPMDAVEMRQAVAPVFTAWNSSVALALLQDEPELDTDDESELSEEEDYEESENEDDESDGREQTDEDDSEDEEDEHVDVHEREDVEEDEEDDGEAEEEDEPEAEEQEGSSNSNALPVQVTSSGGALPPHVAVTENCMENAEKKQQGQDTEFDIANPTAVSVGHQTVKEPVISSVRARTPSMSMSADSSSSVGLITPPTSIKSLKRGRPSEFDQVIRDESASPSPSKVLKTDVGDVNERRPRGLVGAIGLVVLGAALGSVGTIAGLMQIAD